MTGPGNDLAARAALLARAGELSQADGLYRQLAGGDPNILARLALPRLQAGHFEDGLLLLDAALRLDPGLALAENMRGMTLARLGRYEEAIASQTRVLEFAPGMAEAYEDRGTVLHHIGRTAEAVSDLARAVELAPLSPTAWSNLAFSLSELGRLDDAATACDRALALSPDAPMLRGERVFLDLARCEWHTLSQGFAALDAAIDTGALPIQPFKHLATPASPARLRANAERFSSQFAPAPALAPRRRRQRIRLGYFSADFQEHATSFLAARLFELHDRDRFDVFGFSFGPAPRDIMRTRLERGFDKLIDISTMDDASAVRLARDMKIDIAIDLKGHTTHSRPGLFAQRLAPLQVNYLAFPGTMGARFMDYLIADRITIAPGEEEYYTEKVVRLPDTYQATDNTRAIGTRAFSRTELGLPERGFVLCCFNNSFKITLDAFDIWTELLRAIDGALLWLFEGNASAAANLRREATARGVAPERLVFAPRMSQADHLARHAHADVFLDTFIYNAHTTASDALWAGVPVITRLGETFPGRVAASLLMAVGLPELIAKSGREYRDLALSLAENPARLAAIKRKLAANRLTAPLFDSARFTRHIEAAYEAMQARAHAGLAPDHLSVAPVS